MKTHPIRTARIALLHTWASTQTEGWWREAFDNAVVPYTYISTQQVAKDDNLNAKYDVIVFPPSGRNAAVIVNGLPMYGNPLPWKKTAETPNLGSEDQTDDMRPGLGWVGVAHLQEFVKKGGLLLTVMDTADFAASSGLTPGLSVAPTPADADHRQRRAVEDGRQHEPDRVRLHRQPRDLVRERTDLQRVELGRRRRRTTARRRRDDPSDGPRHR